MKKFLSFLFLSFIVTISIAQIPNGYYDSAEGKTGDELRMALRSIITNGHQSNSYDDLYSYYETTDNFGDNKVWDMYSIKSDGTADYWYYFGQGQECGQYSSEGDCYNREHSVPQSWFDKRLPMRADLFIVYPTDGKVNGMRSSYPYGETDAPDWVSSNGSKKGPCSFPGYSGTVFEPIDCYKGDFARTYFYTVTRYDVSDWGGESFSGDGLSSWALQLFLKWNDEDPVSQKEIDRNNAVYNIQGNRNPYIDHPEWVHCVFDNQCSGLYFTSSPVVSGIINQQYTYNIAYQTENEQETLTCEQKPSWLTFTANTDNNTAVLTGSPTVAGDYEVSLKLTEGSNTAYQNFTISVSDGSTPTYVLNEDFSTCPATGWTTYSVSSDKNWECSTEDNAMYINGYEGSEPAEDWLITPALNLDDYTNEILTFKTYTKYGDDGIADPELTVCYSVDYPGSGNPDSYTWTELNYNYPAENSQTWTSSGDIDLSGVSGTNVYIGFKYESSGTGANSTTIWELTDVQITASNTHGSNSQFVVNPTSLNNFSYIEGFGPSDYQSFSLAGNELDTSDVTLVASSDYLISTDSTSGYSSSIVLPEYDGKDTSIYVIMKSGLAKGQYKNESVTISGGGTDQAQVVLNGEVVIPEISLSSTSLNGFSYLIGNGPSSSQNITLSGTNLDGNKITITAPNNFEVSLDDTNFYNILKIDYSSKNNIDTTLYVRMKAGLSENSYSEDINIEDNGNAASITLNVSGTVSAGGGGNCEDFNTLSTSSYETGTKTLSTGDWYINNVYNEDASRSRGGTGHAARIKNTTGASLTTPIINNVGSISFWYRSWNSDNASYDVSVQINNGDFTSIGTINTTSVDYQEFTYDVNNATDDVKIKIERSSGERLIVDDFCWTAMNTNKYLAVSDASIIGLDYYSGGGPSEIDSFVLSGSSLDGTDVTLTAPSNFEISLDGSSFSSSLTLSTYDGTNTKIFARLKAGLSVATYTGDIQITGGGAADITVNLEGDVKAPELIVSPNKLYGFETIVGQGPSSEKSFTLTGKGFSSKDITITAPAAYEVTDDISGTFDNSLILTSYDGQAKTIYVRLKGSLPAGAYNGDSIKITGSGVSTEVVIVSGDVRSPEIMANPTVLSDLSYNLGSGPSIAKTFILSGLYLNGADVTVTAPEHFEISEDNNSFSSSLNIPSYDGTEKTIYVRLKSNLDTGMYDNEKLVISGGGASDFNVYLSGKVYSPELSVSATSITGFSYVQGSGPSNVQSILLRGEHLNGTDIILTAPENFEISDNNSAFSSSLLFSSYTTLSKTVYIRMKAGLSVGEYNNEILTISGGGVSDMQISLSGSVTSATSIDEKQSEFNIYPNPVSNGVLTIKTYGKSKTNITIISSNGQIVKKYSFQATQTQIDLSGLNKGIYYLEINNENNVVWKKIVIE